MTTTRDSLLRRVRDFDDAGGWSEFDKLYRPLLLRYAQRRGLGADEAEEIAQQCLEVIVSRIQTFERRASFRGWLQRIVDNKVKQHLSRRGRQTQPRTGVLENQADDAPTPEALWEQQWNRTHLLYCLVSLRADFAAHTLQAFELYVLQGVSARDAAEMLGMTPNQIYIAKCRVMRRLKERSKALLDKLYGESR